MVVHAPESPQHKPSNHYSFVRKVFKGVTRTVGLTLTLVASVSISPEVDASEFDPLFDADVRLAGNGRAVAVQADGKVIVGGYFIKVGEDTQWMLARYLPDGERDDSFDVGTTINGTILAVALQSDGQILIGGSFTTAGGGARAGIARLNPDGSLDSTFNPGTGFDGVVWTLAVQTDGKVLVGGSFSTFNGTTRSNFARLNTSGSLDTGYNPAPNYTVYDIALQDDGQAVIGGGFTQVGGATRNGIARVTATGAVDAGVTFGTGANGAVVAVAIDSSGRFLVGGTFTTFDGTSRTRIARLTSAGAIDSTFNPPSYGFDGTVYDIQLDSQGRILVGGRFDSYSPGRDLPGVVRLNNASYDSSFDVDSSDLALRGAQYVSALAVGPGDSVYVAGFVINDRTGRSGLLKLDADGDSNTDFDTPRGLELTPSIHSMTPASGGITYLTGEFSWILGSHRENAVRIQASGEVDPYWTIHDNNHQRVANFDGAITALVPRADGSFWAFGAFTHSSYDYNGNLDSRPGSIKLNGYGELDSYSSVIEITGGHVTYAAKDSAGRIILAGTFTAINGTARAGVARVAEDGTLDSSFDPGSGLTDGSFSDLQIDDSDRVLLAGSFTDFAGSGESYLVRLGIGGVVDTAFAGNTAINGILNGLHLLPSGKLLIGGNFTSSGGYSVNGIDRLNDDGTSDDTFVPGSGANNYVYGISADRYGRPLLAGAFTALRDETRPGVGRLGVNGAADSLFANTTISGGYPADVLELGDGKLLVHGTFTDVDGERREQLARFHPVIVRRGDLDSVFSGEALANNSVRGLIPTADGGFVVAGAFSQFDGVTRDRIAKIDAFGELDPDYAAGSSFNNTVEGLLALPEGKILAWGPFTSFAGSIARGLIQLNADGTRDTAFNPPVISGPVRSVFRRADGLLYVGGDFASVGGSASGGVIRLQADGSLDATFSVAGTNPNIKVVAGTPDGGVLVGGSFSNFAGEAHIGLVKLDSTGALDAGFDVGTGGSEVRALLVFSDGSVLVGGTFATFNDIKYDSLVYLNADGSIKEDFLEPYASYRTYTNAVNVIAPLNDGRIYLGGSFRNVASGARRHVARLYSDLQIDPTFDPGESFNQTVWTVAPLSDGRLAVGGDFTNYRGVTRNRVAVLYTGDTGVPGLPGDELVTYEVAEGGDLTFGYGEGAGFSYQWFRDGVRLVGETNASISITDAALADLGRYTLRFSNGAGEYTTMGVDVIVKLSPVLTSSPTAVTVGYGADAGFGVSVDGPGPFTFQWYKNGVAIIGATSSTYTAAGVGDDDFGAAYHVVVTNAYGNVATTPVVLSFDPAAVPGAVIPFYSGGTELDSQVPTAVVRTPGGQYYVATGNGVKRYTADGSVDDTFVLDPALTNVNAQALYLQSDGKLLMAGRAYHSSSWYQVFRFLSDGSLDPSFTPPSGSQSATAAIAVLADGRIALGGSFSSIAGQSRRYLALLNADGTLDTGFAPTDASNGPSSTITDLKAVGNQIIITGNFVTYAGSTANRIARLNANGTLDSSFVTGDGANGVVSGLSPASDGKWLIFGSFSNYAGVTRNRVARINTDGSLDTSFDPVGWTSFYPPVGAQEVENGAVVVAGNFTSFAGWPTYRTARLTSTGVIDTQWTSPNPPDNQNITALLKMADGSLLAIGNYVFETEGSDHRLARILSGDFPPQPPSIVEDPSFPAGDRPAGSTLSLSPWVSGPGTLSYQWYRNGSPLTDSLLLQGATTRSLLLRSVRPTDAGAYVLRVTSDETGSTDTAAAILSVQPEITGSGSLDLSWAADSTGTPAELLVGPDDAIYVVSNASQTWVRKLGADGLAAAGYDSQQRFNNAVTSMALQSTGKLVLGGTFASVSVPARNRLARLNADGTLDTGFEPEPNSTVNGVLVLADDRILVWGDFTTIAGASRERIALLSSAGTADGSFSAATNDFTSITMVARTSTGKYYVVGNTGTSTDLIRLNANGTLDTGFARVVAATGSIRTLVVDNVDQPITGGSFTELGGTAINRLARITTAGALDESWGPVRSSGADSTVYDLRFGDDGFLYVLGSFTRYDGFAIKSFLRLDANGQLDLGYPEVKLVSANADDHLAWQNGQPLLWGSIGGFPRSGVVRLNAGLNPTGALTLTDASPDRVVGAGSSPSLYARFVGEGPVTYAWTHNGTPVIGAIGPELILRGVTSADAGTYIVTATNSYGSVSSTMEISILTDTSISVRSDFVFTAGFSNTLFAMVRRSDGSVIVGGQFATQDATARRGLVALTPAGALDTTFNGNLPFNNSASVQVTQIIEEPDGRLLVMGRMSMTSSGTYAYLIRLNADGTLNANLMNEGNVDRQPSTFARLSDGSILVGGSSLDFGGYVNKPLYHLNASGAIAGSFDPDRFSGSVYDLWSDAAGRVYASAYLTIDSQSYSNELLLRFTSNLSKDTGFIWPFGTTSAELFFAADGRIFAWASNETLNIGGVPSALVEMDDTGTVNLDFLSEFNSVRGVAEDQYGRLFVTGRRPDYNNDELARLLPTGVLDRSVRLTNSASLLRGYGDQLLVGGHNLNNINFVSVTDLASVNVGSLDPLELLTPPGATSVAPGGDLVLRTGVRGSAGASFQWYFNGEAISGATSSVLRIANFGAGNAGDYTLSVTSGEDVLTTDPIPVSLLTNSGRPGEVDLAWGAGMRVANLEAMATDDAGNVYLAGGYYSTGVLVNGTGDRPLVALDPGGQPRSDFNLSAEVTGAATGVKLLADGRIALFSSGYNGRLSVSGTSNIAWVILNADGSLDESFDYTQFANYNVPTLVERADGSFLVPRSPLMRVAADGTQDQTFDPGFSGTVQYLFPASGGKWWAVGTVSQTNPTRYETVWRLNEDGTKDTTYTPRYRRAGEYLASAAGGPSGELYVAFNWRVSTGQYYFNVDDRIVQRFNPDGTVDGNFAFGTLESPDNALPSITSMTVDDDGRLVITGKFTAYDGLPRNGVVRLLPDGSPDPSFVNPGGTPVTSTTMPELSATTPAGRVLVYGDALEGLGGLTDRSGLFGLLGPDPAASTLPVVIGSRNVPAPERFAPLALALPVFAPSDVAVQWYKDGTAIPGATHPRYYRGSAASSDSGVYQAELTTAGGAFTAPPISVSIPAPNYPGPISDRTAGTAQGGPASFAVPDPSTGGVLVVSTYGTIVDGKGPYDLYRLGPDGAFLGGLSTRILAANSNSNPVSAVVVDTIGRVYLSGGFTHLNGESHPYLVRLNPDGSIDETWSPPAFNSSVHKLLLAPDGKLYVGGNFSNLGTVANRYLSRLNTDGTLDETFAVGSKPHNSPNIMALQSDGRLLVGSGGNYYNGIQQGYLLRLENDGSLDPTFAPGMNSLVYDMVVAPDDSLVVAGYFNQVDGVSLARPGLAWFNADGSASDIMAGSVGGPSNFSTVFRLADGRVVAGYASNFYRFNADGSADTDFNDNAAQNYRGAMNLNTQIGRSSLVDGRIVTPTQQNYSTSSSIAQVVRRGSPVAWIDMGGSAAPLVTATPADADVSAGGLVNWTVTATSPDGSDLTYLWTKDGESGTVYGTTASLQLANLSSADAGVYRLTISNAAGQSEVVVALNVLPYNATGPGASRLSFYPESPAAIGATLPNGIAPAAEGKWWVTASDRLYRLLPDGSLDDTFTPRLADGYLSGLRVGEDGRVYIWGNFTSFDGENKRYFVRLTADGSVDTSFTAGFTQQISITDLAVDDSRRIYVSWRGVDVLVGTTSTAGIIRLREDGTIDTTFDPQGGARLNGVDALELLPDGRVVIAGLFTSVGSTTRKGVARLLTDGTVDPSFNPVDVSNLTSLLRTPDGKLLIAGNFFTVDGVPRSRVARLTADGYLDTSFELAPLNLQNAELLLMRPDGRFYASVSIYVGSETRSRLVGFLPDGTVDPAFDGMHEYYNISSNGTFSNGGLTELLLQPNGDMLVRGSFSHIDQDLPRSRLALIQGVPLGPEITASSLEDVDADEGDDVSFGVTAAGAATLTYQWRLDGEPIDGATNATLNLTNVAPAAAGEYDVVVSNTYGSVTSAAATLTVAVTQVAQTITFAALPDIPYSATPITLSATASSSLDVVFELVSGPAILDGNDLTLTGTGTVTVRATQPGNASYLAATPIDRAFAVTTPLTGFQTWQQGFFNEGEIADANLSGPTADPDGDGFTNLLEYALGLDPKTTDTTDLPEVSTTATDWVYTFTRPSDRAELTYEVEVSTNLTSWTITLTPTFVSTSGAIETWQATYPLSSATNAFFRLKVVQ
jgi:uncharacterized delta-60 repeat protein